MQVLALPGSSRLTWCLPELCPASRAALGRQSEACRPGQHATHVPSWAWAPSEGDGSTRSGQGRHREEQRAACPAGESSGEGQRALGFLTESQTPCPLGGPVLDPSRELETLATRVHSAHRQERPQRAYFYKAAHIRVILWPGDRPSDAEPKAPSPPPGEP